MINLLISLINLLIKPEPQKIEIDFGSKPITTTTAMALNLDVIIAQRVKAALYDKNALEHMLVNMCTKKYKCDFLTYFKEHYSSYIVTNYISASEFIQDHRDVFWDLLIDNDKIKNFYSFEEVTNIYFSDTIKIFKAAIALIDDEDESGIDNVNEAYCTGNWLQLTECYIYALIEKFLDDDDCDLCQMINDYFQYETSKRLAIQKIKRNQLFNCGLGLKLSMRDCGIELTT